MREATISILLFRCGPWMVGVDPLAVRTIRPMHDNDRAIDIGTFLRGARSSPYAGDKPRILEVGEDALTMSFRVDHAVGTKSMTLADVFPLSRVLELYGAPPWWLGTTTIDEQLVLLINLEELAKDAKIGIESLSTAELT